MTTGNPYTANLSREPFNEACRADETRTARLNQLHTLSKDNAELIGIGKQNKEVEDWRHESLKKRPVRAKT